MIPPKKIEQMDESPRLRRLRWLCRRGMKELDILLEGFVERQAVSLAANGWPEFEALLQCEDDRIWDWLQDPAHPGANGFQAVLIEIRGGAARVD